jgi:peptide/nickel transport system substrate-binding protein
MRDGVHFSDGEPLTADDVVFSYDFVMNEKIAAPRERSYYSQIASVTKKGTNRVVFTYKQPYFQAFELAASLAVMPKHFYGKYTPDEFNQSVGLLMGSGPYRLESPTDWKPGGDQIALIRNERYWGVQPAFDRRVFKMISNDKARLTSFRNGELDTFSSSPEQFRELLQDRSLLERTQHFQYLSPSAGYRFIAWNEKQGGKPTVFADKRVRQAMTMLIDRQRYIQDVMLGYAVEATGPFNPLSKQCSPEIKPWPYDVVRAKSLLTEAGFKPGPDGILVGPDGQPFRFKLTYPSGSANYEKMVLLLKDSFVKAGIILDQDPLEWSVFTDRLNTKNFQAISLGWSAGIESDIFQMFHSSQMLEEGDDFMSYKNEELDKVIDEARRTVDENKRMELWHRAHQILWEDQPYTFLSFGQSLIFVDKRFANIEKVKMGLNPTEEWYVPRDQQRWTH